MTDFREDIKIKGGSLSIEDGTEGAGKVLTSDVDGLATWAVAGGGDNLYTADGTLTADRTITTATFDTIWSGTGNVGIGVAPTGGKLHVGGDTQIDGNITQTGVASTVSLAGGNFYCNQSGGITAMYLDQTSYTLANSSLYQLGNIQVSNVATGGYFEWRFNAAGAHMRFKVPTTINEPLLEIGKSTITNKLIAFNNSNYGIGNASGKIFITGDATAGNVAISGYDGTTVTDHLTVKMSTGNVGIGIAPTAVKLHVGGDTQINGKTTITATDALQLSHINGRFSIGASVDSSTHIWMRGDRSILMDLGTTTTSIFKVDENGQTIINNTLNASGTLLRINRFGETFAFTMRTESGNVGIGAGSAPGEKLHVGGNVRADLYKVGTNQVVGAQGAAVIDATDAATAITQLNALLARCRTHGLIA